MFGSQEELLPRLFDRSVEPCTTEASSAESSVKDFLQAASVRIELMTSEYSMAVVEALHTVVMKVSQEEARLRMSIIALSSSSIVVPCDEIWELKLSYSLRCA